MMLEKSEYSEQCSETVDVGKSTLQPPVTVSTETKLSLSKEENNNEQTKVLKSKTNVEVVGSPANKNDKRERSEADSNSPPVTKKTCFKFGTTSVVRTVQPEEKKDNREEVPLGEQLAMSSEEEEEKEEDLENNGEYWMKMISGSCVEKDQSNLNKEVGTESTDALVYIVHGDPIFFPTNPIFCPSHCLGKIDDRSG